MAPEEETKIPKKEEQGQAQISRNETSFHSSTEPAPVASLVQSTPSMLERADALNKSIQDGIARLEKLKDENEAIAARILISGRAEAGQVSVSPEQERKERIDKEVQNIVNAFTLK